MISDLELFERLKLFDWLNIKARNIHPPGKPSLHSDFGRGRILTVLTLENDLSTRELANRVGIRISSLNEILAKMAEEDIIKRIPLEADKRIKLNHLTEKGRDLAKTIARHPLFECLSDSEKDEFGRILDKLNGSLEMHILQTGCEELRESCNRRKEALERYLRNDQS